MNKPLFALFWALIFSITAYSSHTDTSTKHNTSAATAINYDEVLTRLKSMPCLIKPKDTPALRSFLKTYLQLRREHSAEILGRTVMYFPMYEKKFREHDMPEELKYLSIVESALKPKATSYVGAGGLWQFMPETGEHYGLHIDEYRDDRSDPEMSTEAAIAYLKNAYERFESWELAIASYNSGPGRVNRAVRRSRSKNFWKLQRYLPRETRSYVPGFIAATYLCQYYAEHEIVPVYPSLDMQMTRTVEIYEHLDFRKVQDLTGLSRQVIEALNPAYTVGFIPANSRGYTLTLPKRVMQSVLDYLAHIRQPDKGKYGGGTLVNSIVIKPKPVKYNTEDEYFTSVYYVSSDEELEVIAEAFGVTKNNIMAWNGLSSTLLTPGQQLTLFHPNKIERWSPKKDVEPLDLIASINPKPLLEVSEGVSLEDLRAKLVTSLSRAGAKVKVKKDLDTDPTSMRGKYIFYRVQEGENWQSIADKFPGVRVEDIYYLNKIKQGKEPRAGQKIKIKKL